MPARSKVAVQVAGALVALILASAGAPAGAATAGTPSPSRSATPTPSRSSTPTPSPTGPGAAPAFAPVITSGVEGSRGILFWSWPADAPFDGADEIVVDISDGEGPVRRVVRDPWLTGEIPLEQLRLGHRYTVTARFVAQGKAGPTASHSFTPAPTVTPFVGTAVVGAGAGLPVAVALSGASEVATTVSAVAHWPGGDAAPVTLAVPAGSTIARGTIPVPAGAFTDAAAHDVDVAFSIPGAEPVLTATVWGSAAARPYRVSIADWTVDEGDWTRPLSSVITLDRPVDRDVALHLSPTWPEWSVTIPAGETSRAFSAISEGNTAPGRDRTYAWNLRPEAGTPPMLLPAVFTGTVEEDDAAAPVLTLVDDNRLLPGAATLPLAGTARGDSLMWANRGTAAATNVRIVGKVSAPRGWLRFTSTSPCTVTPGKADRDTTFTCTIGSVPAGAQGAVALYWGTTVPGAAAFEYRILADGVAGTAWDQSGSDAGTVDGDACTVTGTSDADVVNGTPRDDVLCGPALELGPLRRMVPGAGDDVIAGAALLDYSGSPKGIRTTRTADGAQIVGWGTDQLRNPWSVSPLSRIVGSAKADTFGPTWAGLDAGAGNDVIWVDPSQARASGPFDGGPGSDRLRVSSPKGEGATIDLSSGRFPNVEQAQGDRGPDRLTGSAVANVLRGGGGDDVIDAVDGIAGNDVVEGGGGSDTCRADVGDKVTCEKITWVSGS
ncbi:MAG: hypothetical protein U0Q15_15750 [Kineosporiaceae bacterium]